MCVISYPLLLHLSTLTSLSPTQQVLAYTYVVFSLYLRGAMAHVLYRPVLPTPRDGIKPPAKIQPSRVFAPVPPRA